MYTPGQAFDSVSYRFVQKETSESNERYDVRINPLPPRCLVVNQLIASVLECLLKSMHVQVHERSRQRNTESQPLDVTKSPFLTAALGVVRAP